MQSFSNTKLLEKYIKNILSINPPKNLTNLVNRTPQVLASNINPIFMLIKFKHFSTITQFIEISLSCKIYFFLALLSIYIDWILLSNYLTYLFEKLRNLFLILGA